MYRFLMLIAAASIAEGFLVTTCFAQNQGDAASPPVNLHPPVNLDANTLRATLSPSQLGLKPQATGGSPALPYGIDYRREAKALVMPLDDKSGWGVGVGLNINSSEVVELSPNSTLGLQPRRAPGLLLHGKF